MKIKAVLFDFIGTTAKEKNSFVVSSCLSGAFIDHGLFLTTEYFNSVRGMNKAYIINEVLERYNLPLSMATAIHASFKSRIKHNLENISAFEDSLYVFSYLLRIGISIGIGTDLSREVFDIIFSHLEWSKKGFNYIGFSDKIGKSRPAPDMIFDMMSKLGIKESKEILKVGDTVASIYDGKKAGCITAALLSGTQSAEELLTEEPDYLMKSLSDIKKIINVNTLLCIKGTDRNRFG
ncbi:MAG TPA: HAD hydrolase-like protein [Chitinophagaceae bacterium]|nr:HAD hydrolase-like protein [Chitinophagaceae bacterium]